MWNYGRTFLLLAGLTALFMAIGYLIGGEGGMTIALLMAGAMNLFAWWGSDRMVLSMYGAEEVDGRSAPALHGLVAQLAERAGLPMPRVYIIRNDQPNAFATGRNSENAAVAASTGLLDQLSHEEIAGVLAHELAHIRNRDTLIMTITATIAGAIGMLVNLAFMFGGGQRNGENGQGGGIGIVGSILLMIVAPIAAMLVQMAISRAREYEADRLGAEICGRPLWLASALGRLDDAAYRIANPEAEHNPATAHMFIVNPLHGGSMDNLFSTHPDTANRIRRLREMAGADAAPPGWQSGGPPRPWGRGRAGAPSHRSGGGAGGPWG